MRILCVTPYYEPAYVYGGPACSIPLLCRALVQQGAEVTVFTTNADGKRRLDVPTGRPLIRRGVKVFYFPRLTSSRYFCSPALALACARQVSQFDIVHINGVFSFPSFVAAESASLKRVPFVISPQGMLMPWAFGYKHFKKALYMRLVERRHLRRAAALICTDEYEKKALQDLSLNWPMYIIPNGIDFRRFEALPPRGALRRSLRIPDEAVVILMLGRLHPIKRPDLAVTAFAHIAGRYPEAHLVFAGPDEAGLKSGLSAIARSGSCADRVHFTGLLSPDEVPQMFADADLFLMTSESENFGIAAAEAMAAGLPIVISEEVGLARYVIEAGAGEVVALQQDSIAEGLRRLLSRPQELRDVGQRGRRVAMHNFDPEVVARRMLECYAEVSRGSK